MKKLYKFILLCIIITTLVACNNTTTNNPTVESDDLANKELKTYEEKSKEVMEDLKDAGFTNNDLKTYEENGKKVYEYGKIHITKEIAEVFNKNYNDTNEHLLLSSGFSDTTGITRQIITFDQDVYSQIKLVVENKGKSEVSLHAYKQNDEDKYEEIIIPDGIKEIILPVVNGEELKYEIDSLGNSMDIDLEIYLIK